MATATAPTREDFAKLLDEAFGGGNLQEGSVIKGKVVAVEKEFAVIDVGLKTEGRVALREFTGPGRQAALKVGDEVEVYLERVENALGEAVLSRDKARREESWGKLEKAFNNSEKVQGVIFNQVKGRLHRRSRRRRGLPAALAGRYSSDPRRDTADECAAAVPDPENGPPARQHRRITPHGSRRDSRRAASGAGAEPRGRSGHRRRREEHHRLRCVR
jgi:hypothetical protein